MSRLSSPASGKAPAADDPPDREREDSQLSGMFLRGFEAGQRLSAREFDIVLPSLLEQFVSCRDDDDEADAARRWATRVLSFARRRRQATSAASVVRG
jgi:hypothetical protein